MSGKILRLIIDDNTISVPELAKRLGVTTRTIERGLAAVRREGVLSRTGPAKGGRWEVLE
jgi:ATP-dependent DNA helicase RecG